MEYLKQINYVVHPEAYKDIEDRIQTIPDILSFCDSQQLHDSNIGLAHGKMALVVLYMIYYRSIQDSKWKNKAILLLAEIRRFRHKVLNVCFLLPKDWPVSAGDLFTCATVTYCLPKIHNPCLI